MSEPSQPPTILVADDEPDVLELVGYRLSRSGFTVVEACDGEEALARALDHVPDLAVLDVMMPKLDGYELTRRLRAADATQRVPVILLTARAQESDIATGFEAGADDYLRKPFNPDELVARGPGRARTPLGAPCRSCRPSLLKDWRATESREVPCCPGPPSWPAVSKST
jgi:DNA-binding response OmpR family regulator